MKEYKNDIAFVMIVFIVVVVFTGVTRVLYRGKGNYVEITVDGKKEIILDINKDTEYSIRQGDSLNIIKIENQRVSVVNANCRDGLCVKKGSIQNNGESIICLPHKVVITIVSGDDKKVDEVSE